MKLHKSIFWARIWHLSSTFFVDHLYPILSLHQNLLGLWDSYLDLNPFEQVLTRLKVTFHETAQVCFELEIWQRVKYFFRRSPISDIIPASEPTRIMTLLLGPSIHLNSPWLYWKSLFMKLPKYFLSSKFDNVKYFFWDHLYPILFLHQNLLELWHSYLGPQSIWTVLD